MWQWDIPNTGKYDSGSTNTIVTIYLSLFPGFTVRHSKGEKERLD